MKLYDTQFYLTGLDVRIADLTENIKKNYSRFVYYVMTAF